MIPTSGDILLGLPGQEQLLTRIGRTYSEGRNEIARQDRTASGRAVKDIVAVKKTFKLAYEMIDGDNLRILEAIAALNTELSLISHYEDGPVTYAVLLKPFDRQRVLSTGTGLWSGVTLEAEEI